jgi:hypothetical protein
LKSFYTALIVIAGLYFPCAAAAAYQYEGDVATKLSVGGYIEGKAIYAFDHNSPSENPSVEIGLDVKASVSSWLSAKVLLKAGEDGKVHPPSGNNVFDQFTVIYQNNSTYIDFNEAYFDIYTGKVDFRLGIQKFAWGRLDEMTPTDNLNTADLTEGGTNDQVEQKIGVPAVKMNYYSDLFNTELAWIPRYVPYRLPKEGERWFPGVLILPSAIKTNSAFGNIPLTTTYKDINMPDFNLSNSETGIRISKYISGWDVSLSYFRGFDVMPLMAAPTDVTVKLTDPVALKYAINANVNLEPRIHMMNVFGFDFTTTMGSFTVRGEYAYYNNKYYMRKFDSVLDELLTTQERDTILSEFMKNYIDSLGAATTQTFHFDPDVDIQEDSMKYGLGLDYIRGDSSVSVQCIQEFIPHYDSSRPVYFIKDGFHTMATFMFKQFLLQNTLEINLGGAYDVEYQDIMLKPSIKYNFTNNLQGIIGVLIIASSHDDSMLGQYSNNDEVFVKLKYSF